MDMHTHTKQKLSSGVRVGIIGCGMAGPVLALFLKKLGYDPVVYERSAGPSNGGLAITLQANGLKVLRLLPEVFASLPGQELSHMLVLSTVVNAETTPVLSQQCQGQRQPHPAVTLANSERPARAASEEGANGWRSFKRETLLRYLVSCAEQAGVEVRWGWRLIGLRDVKAEDKSESAEPEVEMEFANGQIERASFVVGCDGLHSAVRSALFGEEEGTLEPKFTGIVQTGGYAPVSPTDPGGANAKRTLVQAYGLNAFFITIPIADDLRCWAVNTREEETKESWRTVDEETKRTFQASQADAGWGAGIDEIIQNSQNFIKYGLYDRPELKTWYKGRIVLLGDAAHPTTPHIGQGANQSYEDIYHLVLSLQKHHPDVSVPPSTTQLVAAFAAYEHVRATRTAQLVQRARGYGNIRVDADVARARARDEAVRMKWLDEEVASAEYEDYARGPYVEKCEIRFK